mgnify:CR=1 FL=1
MGRVCILARNAELCQKIIEMYKQTDDMMQISKAFNVPYHQVRNFLKSTEKKSLQVVSTTKVYAVKSLEQNFDAYNRLIEKVDEIERFVQQLGQVDANGIPILDETGKPTINLNRSKDFLVAWNSVTDTLKWWMERKIKFMELMQNELFRVAIIETIEKEFPAVAQRIKEIIEEKKKIIGGL